MNFYCNDHSLLLICWLRFQKYRSVAMELVIIIRVQREKVDNGFKRYRRNKLKYSFNVLQKFNRVFFGTSNGNQSSRTDTIPLALTRYSFCDADDDCDRFTFNLNGFLLPLNGFMQQSALIRLIIASFILSSHTWRQRRENWKKIFSNEPQFAKRPIKSN